MSPGESVNPPPNTPLNVTAVVEVTSTYCRIVETSRTERCVEAPVTPLGAVVDAVKVRIEPTPAVAGGKPNVVDVVPPPCRVTVVLAAPTVAVATAPGVGLGAAGGFTLVDPPLHAASRAAKVNATASRWNRTATGERTSL